MSIVYTMLAWILLTTAVLYNSPSTGQGVANTTVPIPNKLSVTACEVQEYVTISSTATGEYKRVKVEEADQLGWYVVPPTVHNYRDYEWKIEDGKLDCFQEEVYVQDVAGLTGMQTSSDLSRHLQCLHASMSYAPRWSENHPGWWVMSIGCPNPIYHDNFTPDDTSDDFIVGYKMPGCPSNINNIEIECLFNERGI